MDIGQNYLIPIFDKFLDVLTIQITFFGTSIPLWAFIAFSLLVTIFLRVQSLLGGLHL